MKNYQTALRLRIFIDEGDTCKGKSLYQTIVHKAREMNLAGATVLRGIMGYGSHSMIHSSKILRLSEDMPVIVEIVDQKEKIEGFLPFIEEVVKEGLVTRETVDVIRYRHDG